MNDIGKIAHSFVPDFSVVVPVYNEEPVLNELFTRLYAALDNLHRSYEVVFVDDGSRDKSVAMLRVQYQARPDVTHVVLLRANAGQHAAIMAGFERARGRCVITMDADMQNPPEEIGKLLEQIDAGHDYVGSIRKQRHDAKWRDWGSKAMNLIRERITGIHMQDQGCMFRAYDKDIVKVLVASNESQTFIPALAYLYAANPVEIEVEHRDRSAGTSKYSPFKLMHLSFDLITSFSIVPLQVFSLIGMVISAFSFLLAVFMVIRRLVYGPEVEGVFTLFAIAFFMLGLLLFAVGILGEYIGRIYSEVRKRPRYLVAAHLSPSQKTNELKTDEIARRKSLHEVPK